IQDGLQRIEFLDIGLDMGSYISGVIAPLVQKVQEVTGPVQPLIDIITTPLPVLSDLGLEITLLDLAKTSGYVDSALIEAIKRIGQIINTINSLALPDDGSLILPFGDFPIFNKGDILWQNPEWQTEINFEDFNLGSADFRLDAFADKLLTSDLSPIERILEDLPDSIANALGGISHEGVNLVKDLIEENKKEDAKDKFSFPIIEDPAQVFGMLMGEPAVLVAYDMAPLIFEFEWSKFFPIWGPLGVSINTEFDAAIDFAFGYDTV
ncbi:unnamed protein product, partial [marine sediment metagenome]